MCHQTVGLVQTELERLGISTASLSVMAEVTRQVQPPRVLEVEAPLGSPVGPPNDIAAHLHLLTRMLARLEAEG